MTFTADQLNVVDPRRRFFFMDARINGLPVDVLHVFDERGATMRVRLLSVRTMVDARRRSDGAETVTVFNDLCCYAPGALLTPDISWESIDGHAAAARFTLGPTTVRAELRFDYNGWSTSSPMPAVPCRRTVAPDTAALVYAASGLPGRSRKGGDQSRGAVVLLYGAG